MTEGIIMVVGGSRSGKSKFAEELATELGERVVYIATAEISDGEMAERITKHQASRPSSWKTIEAPYELPNALMACQDQADVILIDCMTVFLSNLIIREIGKIGETDNPPIPADLADQLSVMVTELINIAITVSATVIIVSNEVGLGLVPPYNLGRFFRDLSGKINRQIALAAQKVYLINCGLAIDLKALAITPQQIASELKDHH